VPGDDGDEGMAAAAGGCACDNGIAAASGCRDGSQGFAGEPGRVSEAQYHRGPFFVFKKWRLRSIFRPLYF